MGEPAVIVEDVSKRFRMYHDRNQSLKAALLRGRRAKFEEFWALRDVCLEVPSSSTFGLIGENGSGKSTLLKCIARILRPDSGSVRATGSIAALLELGSGFHPELSGRENVYLNASILGMKKAEIDRKFDAIVDFAGIEQFIDQPVKNYSSGMYVRLGFSVAINVDPEILLVDEVLAVGDAASRPSAWRSSATSAGRGRTVVLVSHAMGSLRMMCDQAAWLQHGRLVDVGPAAEIVDTYSEQIVPTHTPPDGSAERMGTGEVTVTSVELLDAHRRPTQHFRTEDPMTIRVHFQAPAPYVGPVFALGLETDSGVEIWAHHSRDSVLEVASVDGDGSIDLEIPHLHLQPGTYTVRAQIHDHTLTKTLDLVRRAGRFDVAGRRPHESGGIVALGSSWRPWNSD